MIYVIADVRTIVYQGHVSLCETVNGVKAKFTMGRLNVFQLHVTSALVSVACTTVRPVITCYCIYIPE